MKMKKFFLLLLCSIALFSCEEDPEFIAETEMVTISQYVGDVGYTYAKVYCQISANVTVHRVRLEICRNKEMNSSVLTDMEKYSSSVPKGANFNKEDDIYYLRSADLKINTNYYCRVVVDTRVGGHFESDIFTIKTTKLSSEAVTTKQATDVYFTYATLHGQMIKAENVTASQLGFSYSMNYDMSQSEYVIADNNSISFSKKITNLLPKTTYYFQAVAYIDNQKYEGEILQFVTNEYKAAEVETGEATDISYNTATCYFNIVSTGNSDISDKGILYSTSRELDVTSAEKVSAAFSGNYVTLENLKEGTKYYYCAYATNGAGTVTGDTKYFTTKNHNKPSVYTGDVSNIEYTTATCSMRIQDEGDSEITSFGILYGLQENLSIDNSNKVYREGSGLLDYDYDFDLKSLTQNRRYYYCAYATNSAGTAYGTVRTFGTEKMYEPEVYIVEITKTDYTYTYVKCELLTHGHDVREYGVLCSEESLSSQNEYGTSQFKKYTSLSDLAGKDYTKSYTFYISSLTAGTSYICTPYVKYNINGEEVIEYGSYEYFNTISYGVPVVTLEEEKNVYTTSATISMKTSSGGTTIKEKGFYISTSSSAKNYTNDGDFEKYSNIWTKTQISTSSLSLPLKNLTPNTTYYYVGYATNTTGTGYSEVKSFKTKALTLPYMEINVSIGSSSVTIEGYTDGGGEDNVTVGIVYSKDYSCPTIENGKVAVYSTAFHPQGSNNGNYTKSVSKSSLEKGNIYYFCTYCTNSLGTSYGCSGAVYIE